MFGISSRSATIFRKNHEGCIQIISLNEIPNFQALPTMARMFDLRAIVPRKASSYSCYIPSELVILHMVSVVIYKV